MKEKLFEWDKKIEDEKTKIIWLFGWIFLITFFKSEMSYEINKILSILATIMIFILLYKIVNFRINKWKWEREAKKEESKILNESLNKNPIWIIDINKLKNEIKLEIIEELKQTNWANPIEQQLYENINKNVIIEDNKKNSYEELREKYWPR